MQLTTPLQHLLTHTGQRRHSHLYEYQQDVYNKQRLDCNSTNIIYAIQCKTCTQNGNDNCQYIGQTGRRLRDRLNEHLRDIINRKTDKSGVVEHFCKPGHSVNNLQILPLLQMHNERESIRRAKEQYFIGLANTLTPNGMNRTTDR